VRNYYTTHISLKTVFTCFCKSSFLFKVFVTLITFIFVLGWVGEDCPDDGIEDATEDESTEDGEVSTLRDPAEDGVYSTEN
jgi:hypothetical protein